MYYYATKYNNNKNNNITVINESPESDRYPETNEHTKITNSLKNSGLRMYWIIIWQ